MEKDTLRWERGARVRDVGRLHKKYLAISAFLGMRPLTGVWLT